MATGRIGTTPVLQVRWSKAPTNGTTSLSGLDDNSVSLVYSVGYEAVYRNGVLLSRGNDYTATNGTTVTLIDATITGDIIEIFANQTVPLSDTFSQTVADGRFIKNTLTTTTGDIIYASGANTPARLGIGSSAQVLTVSGGIPAWTTPAGGGGMTLIASGSLSGANVTISSISSAYNHLQLIARDSNIYVAYDDDNGGTFDVLAIESTTNNAALNSVTNINVGEAGIGYNNPGTTDLLWIWNVYSYKTSGVKKVYNGLASGGNLIYQENAASRGTAAITEVKFIASGGTFSAGTYELWGIK